jgi:hypothetical protein
MGCGKRETAGTKRAAAQDTDCEYIHYTPFGYRFQYSHSNFIVISRNGEGGTEQVPHCVFHLNRQGIRVCRGCWFGSVWVSGS